MDALFQASLVFVYAAIGLAVALWRVAKMLVAAVVGGVLAYWFEREGSELAYQPEESQTGGANNGR